MTITLSSMTKNYGSSTATEHGRSCSEFASKPTNSFIGSFKTQNEQNRKQPIRKATKRVSLLRVAAKVERWKKQDYPWPEDLGFDVKSGHLSYLSHFKPLTEKPKPVTLPFEKPLIDLEKRIIEVRRIAEETELDFSDQIADLESKYQQALEDLYSNLTPMQRLNIARHPNRPTVLDHIFNITEKWIELHGDRAGYDDPAIVTGLGTIDGTTYMFIGQQKGRNTKENVARNFAMPTPHGYRKALRMMKYADHHGFPIITLIDSPGAFADIKSEELGQGEAIARNIMTMVGLKVPIVTIVTGEGGSGGALAIGCADKMYMLENSVLYVASPEACAAILWKSSQAAPKAADKLRLTAQEHYKLKIADGIILEPVGGAHLDPNYTSQQIKLTIIHAMEELKKMDKEELLRHRALKYRHIGGFQEGQTIEAERKRNMKPSEINEPNTGHLKTGIESLKEQILESKTPSKQTSLQYTEKLKKELDNEMMNAFRSMGLQEKVESVKLEISKLPHNEPLDHDLKDRVDKIVQEFNQNLSKPGAYLSLKQRLDQMSQVSKLIERNVECKELKAQINEKITDEVRAMMKTIGMAKKKLSNGEELDAEFTNNVEKAKNGVVEFLKSNGLEIIGVTERNNESGREIIDAIKNVINERSDVRHKIEELKMEIMKCSGSGSGSGRLEKLKGEIKEEIFDALLVAFNGLMKDRFNKLMVEDLSSSSDMLNKSNLGNNETVAIENSRV